MVYFTVEKFKMMSLHWIDVCHYCEDERTCRGGEEKGQTALADEESSTVPPHASTPKMLKGLNEGYLFPLSHSVIYSRA